MENFDALTLEVVIAPGRRIKWTGQVEVKVTLVMQDLAGLERLQFHSSPDIPQIQVEPSQFIADLLNPSVVKVINARISRSPIQLRDILPMTFIDPSDRAFFKIVKVCSILSFYSSFYLSISPLYLCESVHDSRPDIIWITIHLNPRQDSL